MKDNEINIAIAEACGYQKIASYTLASGKRPDGFHPKTNLLVNIPDYLYDLNAMHEAEKVLDAWPDNFSSPCPYALDQYCINLNGIVGHNITTPSWAIIHATARQRAEAFLRTFGKWKD